MASFSPGNPEAVHSHAKWTGPAGEAGKKHRKKSKAQSSLSGTSCHTVQDWAGFGLPVRTSRRATFNLPPESKAHSNHKLKIMVEGGWLRVGVPCRLPVSAVEGGCPVSARRVGVPCRLSVSAITGVNFKDGIEVAQSIRPPLDSTAETPVLTIAPTLSLNYPHVTKEFLDKVYLKLRSLHRNYSISLKALLLLEDISNRHLVCSKNFPKLS